MSDQTSGRRFTHIYITRGEPIRDSEKARFRLAKLAEKSCHPPQSTRHGMSSDYNKAAQENIERELGIKFGTRSTEGTLYRSWELYFKRVSISEMLDTITVIAHTLYSEYRDKRPFFVHEAQRIMKEENLSYEIDKYGGVHPLVDASFSAAVVSAIGILEEPRYLASAKCIEQIDGFLLQNPQDFIGAIRAVFGACENTFKLMHDVPRLDAKSVGERIGRDQQRLYSEHPILQSVSQKTLESFKQWINAVHFYRHEQGIEIPNQPTSEVAILLISQGLSFVRWLAVLDKKISL